MPVLVGLQKGKHMKRFKDFGGSGVRLLWLADTLDRENIPFH